MPPKPVEKAKAPMLVPYTSNLKSRYDDLVGNVAMDAVEALDVAPTDLLAAIGRVMDQEPSPKPRRTRRRKRATFTPVAQHVLDLAYAVAQSLGHRYIGTEHLMLALMTVADEPDGAKVRAALTTSVWMASGYVANDSSYLDVDEG